MNCQLHLSSFMRCRHSDMGSISRYSAWRLPDSYILRRANIVWTNAERVCWKYLKGVCCIRYTGKILLILHRNVARKRNNFSHHATSQSVSWTNRNWSAAALFAWASPILRPVLMNNNVTPEVREEKNFLRFMSEELISRRRYTVTARWNGFVTRV